MLRPFGIFVIVIILVALFGPVPLGGLTTYAIITGNSMEPSFSKGDLVVTRAQKEYSIGDIVLYNHPELGPVFHRIVENDNNRFILKGDHNGWIDSYQASPADIQGKYWFSIPGMGRPLSWFHSPEGLSITSIAFGVLMIGTTASRQNAKRVNEKQLKKATQAIGHLGISPISIRDAFLLMLALFLIFLLLGAYTLTKPVFVTVSTSYPTQHVGVFSYSSDIPAEGIYDHGYLQPGDPIFRRISNSFDLSFSYHLLAEGLSETQGTYSLSAIVGETNGWTRTVELVPTTPFEGDSISISSTISIDNLQAIVDNLERTTGVELSQYSLNLQPTIQVLALVRGLVWQDEFSPSLPFIVNDIEVRPNGIGIEEDQLFTQVETGSVSGSTQEVNTLGPLGIKINIQVIRTLLVLFMPVLAIGCLVSGWSWLKLARGGEVSRIESTYGPKLVDVKGLADTSQLKQITVYKIDDLVRIADREGSNVFHEKAGGFHYYFVEARNGIYIYRLETGME